MFQDIEKRIINFSTNFELNTYRIIRIIEDASAELDNNVNPELLLFKLFYSIKIELKRKSKM